MTVPAFTGPPDHAAAPGGVRLHAVHEGEATHDGSVRPATLRQSVDQLHARRRAAADDVELRARQRHAASGKRTARERIDLLLDKGTFVEMNQFTRHRATGLGM